MVSNKNSYFAMVFRSLHAKSAMLSYLNHTPCQQQGRRQEGLGLNPPFSLIFHKTFLPAQMRLIVFSYFLLVNLST